MSGSQRPLEPVAPDGMELLFFYRCPHCLRHVPLVNPVEPRNVRCDGCGKQMRVGVEPLRLPLHRSGPVRLPAPDIMVGALRTHDHVHDLHPGTQASRAAGIYYAVGTGAQYHPGRGGCRIDLAYPRLLHAGDSAAPERIVFRLHRYKYTSFHNRCKILDSTPKCNSEDPTDLAVDGLKVVSFFLGGKRNTK